MSNQEQEPLKQFYIHLVSDATGTTLLGLARACLAQFEHVEPVQKFWPLVRSERQLERVIARIKETPGPVIFTFVDHKMRHRLQDFCEELGVPCVAVLDPIIRSLSSYLGEHAKGVPGLQHAMDDAYYKRVEAVDYAMRHDDGKTLKGLSKADVILVGVSRTSKTPTSVFLARRGIKVANIPLYPVLKCPMRNSRLKNQCMLASLLRPSASCICAAPAYMQKNRMLHPISKIMPILMRKLLRKKSVKPADFTAKRLARH